MAMKNTVAGPMKIKLGDGIGTLKVLGDHTYNLGIMKRTPILGPNNEYHGNKREPVLGKISGKIVVTQDMVPYIPVIMGMEDGEVTLSLPTGGEVTMLNASQTGDGDGSTDEGTMNYEFSGRITKWGGQNLNTEDAFI